MTDLPQVPRPPVEGGWATPSPQTPPPPVQGGWYAPPPQPPPQPPPPPTRRRGWPTWATVLIVVVVLCCGGGAIGGVFLFRGVFEDIGPVQEAADSFFQGLVNGSDVYGQLCAPARSSISKDQFERARASRPPQDYKVTYTNVTNVNGHKSATVTVQLRFDSGIETHLVPMASEDGTWKVCGRPY